MFKWLLGCSDYHLAEQEKTQSLLIISYIDKVYGEFTNNPYIVCAKCGYKIYLNECSRIYGAYYE